MANFDFPVFTTHVADSPRFDLSDPVERRRYFDLKAGPETEKLRDWLRDNTFVGFPPRPKNPGKGTYPNLLI